MSDFYVEWGGEDVDVIIDGKRKNLVEEMNRLEKEKKVKNSYKTLRDVCLATPSFYDHEGEPALILSSNGIPLTKEEIRDLVDG